MFILYMNILNIDIGLKNCENDRAFLDMMMKEFLKEVETYINHKPHAKMSELKRFWHNIKTNARILGFERLANAAENEDDISNEFNVLKEYLRENNILSPK